MIGGGRRRGRRCGSIQTGGTNSAGPLTRWTSQPAWWTSRWQSRQSMTRLASFVSPPCSHGRTWWTSHQRGRASAAGAAAVAGGDRAAQALGDGAGGPPDVQRLTGPAQHDRHHRRVTGEHPQRRRGQAAAEIQGGGAGPLLQIGEPDQDVQLRSPPTGGGQGGGVGVVEHPAARVGQRLGLALSGGAVVGAGARRGVGVDEGGDRVEHRRVVEPADQPAHRRCGGVAGAAR